MPALGRPTALALPAHAPAQLPAQLPARTPAHVAWCVCTNVRTFSPQVRRRSGRRRLMPVPVGLLPIRPPGLPPPLRTRDPVPRCLGWLAAAALAYKGLARASNTSPSRVAWVGWLHTGCERACAPPSTLLGRLQRVVLPVKRDRSPDNPKVCGDYSSCAPDSVGACPFALRKGLPRRSWACPAAQRGVLNAEGASATTTAPKCT